MRSHRFATSRLLVRFPIVGMIAAAVILLSSTASAHQDGEDTGTGAAMPPPIHEMLALAVRNSADSGAHAGAARRRQVTALQRVVIDPGHGGRNEGAIGVGEVHEKHLTLPIAVHLADRLRAQHPDLEVVLTREADVELGLAERAQLANDMGADLFISIHLNAATNPEAVGYETYWIQDASPVLPRHLPAFTGLKQVLGDLPRLARIRQKAAQRAQNFLYNVHFALGERLKVMDRGIKQGNYTVLRTANVPAVVIELGFLTHADEGKRVLSPAYQARLVDGMLDAIKGYDLQLTAELEQTVAQD